MSQTSHVIKLETCHKRWMGMVCTLEDGHEGAHKCQSDQGEWVNWIGLRDAGVLP